MNKAKKIIKNCRGLIGKEYHIEIPNYALYIT